MRCQGLNQGQPCARQAPSLAILSLWSFSETVNKGALTVCLGHTLLCSGPTTRGAQGTVRDAGDETGPTRSGKLLQ